MIGVVTARGNETAEQIWLCCVDEIFAFLIRHDHWLREGQVDKAQAVLSRCDQIVLLGEAMKGSATGLGHWIWCTNHAGWQARRGHLSQALAELRDCLFEVNELQWPLLQAGCHLDMARIHCEQGDIEAAHEHLDQFPFRNEQPFVGGAAVDYYLIRAQLFEKQGRLQAAKDSRNCVARVRSNYANAVAKARRHETGQANSNDGLIAEVLTYLRQQVRHPSAALNS